MTEQIKKIADNYLKGSDVVLRIEGLYGDASYRRYYRLFLKSGKTLIVMKMPAGLSSASEEITNYKGDKEEPPYINVSKYLSKIGMPVPEVHFYDKQNGTIVLEDIGDALLLGELESSGSNNVVNLYKTALDLLIKLQREAKDDGKAIPFKRSFNATLLNWEFNHFLEYGIEARLDLKVTPSFRDEFARLTGKITGKITGMKEIFVHRDFQSKNIMLKEGRFFLIDFQDALLGPYVYDPVALLRDSYFSLESKALDELIAYYSKSAGLNEKEVRRDFDLVTIQRKLKDAGRFVYIDKVKGNSSYLKYIPSSLSYVKSALTRNPEHKELQGLLEPYLKG